MPQSPFDGSTNGDAAAYLGYDPATGAQRVIPYARKTLQIQFFKAQAVSAGNTTPIYTPERYDVSNYDKIRLFIKASGAGNIEVLIRASLDGAFTFTPIATHQLGTDVKTFLTPIETLGVPLINLALNNKSPNIQTVDVWGFLY